MSLITTILLFLIVALVVILASKAFNPPKWKQVYDFIYELRYIHEESYSSIEANLISHFGLSKHHARLCINNFGNKDWFQMQSFLE